MPASLLACLLAACSLLTGAPRPAGPRAISAESLRVALSAADGGGNFKLGDMADAAEAFEALLERLKSAHATAAASVFEMVSVDQPLTRVARHVT